MAATHQQGSYTMQLSAETIAEMEVLALFDLSNTQAGIKIHHDAAPSRVAAAVRLHAKGLISQPDGGYLSSLGIDAAEHVQGILTILQE